MHFHRWKRREFILLLGAAAAWPLAARAQQPGALRRIGMLTAGDETDPVWKVNLVAFAQGLRSLGWVEGQNLRTERRLLLGDPDHARAFVSELLRLSPDVIFSAGTANLTALLRQAPTVPIVFIQVSDPVAQGFASNLAHPEGNITGLSAYEFSIGGKWTDLLKQMWPDLAHVVLVFNPDTAPQSRFFVTSVEAVAPTLGVTVTAAPVRDPADIERVIENVARQPKSGLVIPTDGFLLAHRDLVVEAAARHRVPAIYNERAFAEVGGLMSYGINYETQFRQAAAYVDRILRGAKPGSLPIQGPTKFDLAVNVKTARALGIEVPMSLLLNADEYIE
jgi:putative tryptophan/tyrosine transport system substrate-binding protein